MNAVRIALQGCFYAGFAVLIGYFAASPSYRHFPEETADIKVSFSHGAQRKGGCRPRTPEELAKLPPNMRAPLLCPRERVPMLLEVEIDGRIAMRGVLPPTGLSRDGTAHVYRRIPVSAGTHTVTLRLRDSERTDGFDYEKRLDLAFAAGQSLPVDFRAEWGGFVIR